MIQYPIPFVTGFRRNKLLPVMLLVALLAPIGAGSQPVTPTRGASASQRLEYTTVNLRDSSLRLSIRNIDITRFPQVSVVFDVMTPGNTSVFGLGKNDVEILENGETQNIIDFSMITRANRVPVDFVFAIDQTGSMGDKIEGVKQNIDEFTTRLAAKGIDYRLGLIVFDDNVAERHWLTDNLDEFKGWINRINAQGGGDEKENALEALRATTGMNFRSSANRCVVLITDAPYHQYPDKDGYGRTMYTASNIAMVLGKREMRTFCIVNPSVRGYRDIATATGGQTFDITQPFADILNNFAITMTSLYSATYETDAEKIPDSIWVQVRLPGTKVVARKAFAVLEVGRKLVVNNIHFATNRATVDVTSTRELDYIVRLMKGRATLRLKIEGHTDEVGDSEPNMQLSIQRADAVRRYMIRAGIDPQRLYIIGYGETRPTASNDTEEGRQLNRRTEFIITQR